MMRSISRRLNRCEFSGAKPNEIRECDRSVFRRDRFTVIIGDLAQNSFGTVPQIFRLFDMIVGLGITDNLRMRERFQ